VPFHARFDPSYLGPRERRERLPGAEEERHRGPSWLVGSGTLACPSCDFPVTPGAGVSMGGEIGCPYCGHAASTRDFLTLTPAPRPTRVNVVATIS
jgi:hypothetical protein